MKQNLIWILVAAATVAFIESCGNKKTGAGKAALGDVYTCPMHPQVIEHHPGDCPICGMKLVKKDTTARANSIELESLLKPANEFVVASFPVITPQQKSLAIPIRVYGTIEYDTREAGSISARVSGRIEKLYLRYRYEAVTSGQKVMDIYSPEVVTAEQNLLFLLKSDPGNAPFIDAAKQRLFLLGVSETELNKIMKTRTPLYSISVYSNYTGHVHDAEMSNDVAANDMDNRRPVTQELSLKEGMSVQKGQELFMIMNHHMASAALQVFSDAQSLVKRGDTVSFVPETDTNTVIKGKIDFIEPFFRNDSKTLTARVYFHNENMLPIGTHVTAQIYSGNAEGLWLPTSAVLSLGISAVAFIKTEGGFVVHRITTGVRANDNVQILSGLNITDSVAANAQYLIDSESFIQSSSK